MAWTIRYTDTARRGLRRLERDTVRRIVSFMDHRVAPAGDPRRMGTALAGPLRGLWRYRVGNCRVICDIQDDSVRVLVVRVGRRDEVYR